MAKKVKEELFFREVLEIFDLWFLDRNFEPLIDLLIKYVPPKALSALIDEKVWSAEVKEYSKLDKWPKNYKDKFDQDLIEESYPSDIQIHRRRPDGVFEKRSK